MKKHRCCGPPARAHHDPAVRAAMTGCGGSRRHHPLAQHHSGRRHITTRVKTALLNDPEIRSKIDVDTFNGVVTLSGAVKTAVERDKAMAICAQDHRRVRRQVDAAGD